MELEQIYTSCLAQGAYFIESKGEAVIIDPLREIQPYLEMACRAKAKIKYIFETHFHADFVSGHQELARETGATIVYGPSANTLFPAYVAKDEECFEVGNIVFKLIHTPGHTLESACFLLKDEEGKDVALFTGDTLFIGDVGRPDLAQDTSASITQEDLAGLLYESLHNKLRHLSDDIIVYPAHGAGSACGKNISKEIFDTLGHQKESNYALREGITKSEFVREVTLNLKAPPAYFPANVQLNQNGYDRLEDVLSRGMRGLSLLEFEKAMADPNTLLLDTRNFQSFIQGFIPGAINIGLDGNFALWVGTLVPFKKRPILFIADEGREEEVVTRLARIGYDDAVGFLKGGFNTWKECGKSIDYVEGVTAERLAEILKKEKSINILDVRNENEYNLSHLQSARSLPLEQVYECQDSIKMNERYYVHCAGGYRSMVFISILKARGYHDLIDVQGGYNAIRRLPEFIIPKTQ